MNCFALAIKRKIFKFFFLLLCVCSLHVQAQDSGNRFTLSQKDVSIKNAFIEIEKLTGYHFIYTIEMLADAGKVTINIKNGSLKDLLDETFRNQLLTYTVLDKTIVVKVKGKTAAVQKSTPVMVKGRVVDENDQPMANVNIIENGTGTSTQSDKDGNFSLMAKTAKADLVFTYVGYKNSLVAGDGKESFTVKMERAFAVLNDVVVIGYQSVRKKDLTGAVSSINAEQLKDIPINSAAQALTGRLAGVQVTTAEGSPDANVRVVVRGGNSITQDNSPLYIIDGMQVEEGLSQISPMDIESIDVLKDAASTAIYGARGANGVVIITTKSGKPRKTVVSLNAFTSTRQLASKLDVLQPYDFVISQYERSRGNPGNIQSFAATYGTTFDTLNVYKNYPFVDWQEKVFGRQATAQTYNASVSGGNASTTFSLSTSYNKEQGIMLNSDYDRKLLNFKLEHKASDKLKINFNVGYNEQFVNGAGTSDDGSQSVNRLRQSVRYRPLVVNGVTEDQYDADYANQTNAAGLYIINPVLLTQADYKKNTIKTLLLYGSFVYNITKNFSFKSSLGTNNINRQLNVFNDTITPVVKSNGGMPRAGVTTLATTSLNNSNVLTYTVTKYNGHHNITALVGQELYQLTGKKMDNQLANFPIGISADRAFGQLNLGTTLVGYPSSFQYTSKLFSYFSSVNYDFDKKYFASVSIRADGSSKFAESKRWGYFPSGSLAWRISQEKFMQNLRFVNDAKLRVGYGLAGNNRLADYLYINTFTTDGILYGLNNVPITAYAPDNLANPDLKWEATTSRNIGLDLALFRNTVQLTVDVYKNSTKDLLIDVPVPTSSGYKKQLQNIASTTNRGVEIQLASSIVNKRDFDWSVNFNVSFYRNRIDKLSRIQQYYLETTGLQNNFDYIVQVGQPVGMMYGLVTDGFYKVSDFDYNATTATYTLKTGGVNNSAILGAAPVPGAIKFKDLNGDGLVDFDHDRTIIGNANPKFSGGLNQQFSYKNFDASAFVNFVFGNDILNYNKIEFTNFYSTNSNLLAVMQTRWRTVDEKGVTVTDPATLESLNANATIWKPILASGALTPHSWAVEDGSFLRLNNITVGYSLSPSLLKKMHISKLRFYVTANNLGIITNYSGYDPEVNTRRSVPTTPGVDYSAYPRSRGYIFGLNVNF